MTTVAPRSADAPVTADRLCRSAILGFSTLLIIGTIAGLIELITDRDDTSSGAGVAVANWVHVGIAAVSIGVAAVARRRDPERLRRFIRAPFTTDGWRRLLAATFALPRWLLDLALTLVGRGPRGSRIRRVIAGLPLAICLSAVAAGVWSVPLRAGEQIFAGFDPDFTRDAWGGPTYLGAAMAHWMDGALLFYVGAAVVASVLRWQHR
jgi:hypothetical protein